MPNISQMQSNTKQRVDSASAVAGITPRLTRLFLDYPEIAIRDEQIESNIDLLEADRESQYGVSMDARRATGAARDDAKRLARHADTYGDEYARQAEAAEAKVGRYKRTEEEASARLRGTISELNTLTRIQTSCRSYLSRFKADDTIKFAPIPKLKGDPAKVIADVDARIADIEARPQPAEAVEAAAIAEVDKYASMPLGRVTFGKRPGFIWTVQGVRAAEERVDPGVIATAPDPRPALARLLHDDYVADIKAQVTEHYRDRPAGMTETEKAKRVEELKAERLAADRVRCKAIWDAYNAGQMTTLALPADADPRAILGIEGPEPKG